LFSASGIMVRMPDPTEHGRRLLEAAREAQRKALAAQAGEPAPAAELYAPAIGALEQAAAAPDAPVQAMQLLGVALMEAGRTADAAAALERVAAQPSAPAGVLVDLGNRYLALGLRAEARRCLARALASDPQHAPAHASHALLLLGNGDFARGWDEYEWRLRAGFDPAPRGPMPYAACGKPDGKHVFVASEQGMGDEVMFASCIPDLLSVAASCVLECGSRLVPLFERSFPQAKVVSRNRSIWPPPGAQGFDCGLWAGSLPRLFRGARERFPGKPYLQADRDAVERWREKLGRLGGQRKVGLAWTGGLPETARTQRSLALADIAPLFEAAGTVFVSLELMDRSAEAREATARGGAPLVHWPGVAADPDRLAALVEALDLVVCVPNAAAHLAGALGKPVKVLVTGAPTWRYLWEGESVPWYASMRVLRRDAATPPAEWLRGLLPALLSPA
jgi:hypothetical protein